MSDRHDGLQQIIDEALESMAAEAGESFSPESCNLAEFCRRTGLTRQRARTIKAHGFKVVPHGRCGHTSQTTVLSGYTGTLDNLLKQGVTNSQVIFERLARAGYGGGLTTVKTYIAAHRDLVPAKRHQVARTASRGQRFRTGPGEAYQMDWGFVNLDTVAGDTVRLACFAMVCHHCGMPYIEFFFNARQESLFVGMLHSFSELGVPEHVLTDNMKSVVIRRDSEGLPVWNEDYAAFMECVGFKTRLCKPRHPYTKGKVERLVRFVKDNFLAARSFQDLATLNQEARIWCREQFGRYRRSVGCAPSDVHMSECIRHARTIQNLAASELYLCPLRKISFDGFVSFEGVRFGVPYWYEGGQCRVSREGDYVHIYTPDLSRELVVHEVANTTLDVWCDGQWALAQPEELPSSPVKVALQQAAPKTSKPAFERFNFAGEVM